MLANADSAAAAGNSTLISQLDSTDASHVETDEQAMISKFPLFAKLRPVADEQGQVGRGPVIGWAKSFDTAAVNRYMSLPQVKALLPRDIKLMWGVKAIDPQETTFALYAIKANTRDGKAPLDGGSVVEAREGYAQHGSSAEVSMTMNASGARTWARLTADNVDRCIAIVLDGYVYSAPVVHGEISGGQSSISGQFTINEARDLANVLKSGKLPAPARITQDTVVGPSLGQESINAGMMSFILAFVLVLIYMIFYYNRAGWVASVALICNLFFLFGVLVSFGAVLTLPGIAGIVLTMGMAVDANVIIYERIKEELRMGKTLAMSVAEGYKNAMSAIIDGNVTTLITGIVLFIFGTGPVQGFATTLIIGIITSLFTAILITRLIFVGMLNRERKITFSNKFTENFLANTKFNFIDKRKITYVISGIMLLITAQLTEAEFLTTAQNPYGIISSDKVGPSVAHDIKVDSVIAVLFSLVAIALYIIIRFKRWQWGVGSVISLTLDALFTIGLFSLLHGLLPFNLEVDQSFIAAILTIIGYSINDKVVIFDRIREYQTLYPKRNIKDNINNAINSTLTRTINTSGTTLVVLLAIFLFGGEVIRGFVFALLFGVLISTYSTVFTATPIAYDLIRRKEPAAK